MNTQLDHIKIKGCTGIHGITTEDIHYWWNVGGTQFLVSIEKEKRLLEFYGVDTAINYLFMNGYRDSARQIHKHNKKG